MPDASKNDGLAMRFNAGKPMFQLIPPEWDLELARVFTAGAAKYAPNNWKNSLNTSDHEAFVQDRIGSLKRHLNAWLMGEEFDPETKCHHMALLAWNALVLYFYSLYKK